LAPTPLSSQYEYSRQPFAETHETKYIFDLSHPKHAIELSTIQQEDLHPAHRKAIQLFDVSRTRRARKEKGERRIDEAQIASARVRRYHAGRRRFCIGEAQKIRMASGSVV
jgi:hypothetical protein